eukprot:scaffold109792_cov90-Phaeocystis_antarctica.AAC.1
MARRLGGGAVLALCASTPPCRWLRAVLAAVAALARARRAGGRAPSWRLARAVPAAARRPGCGTPSRLRRAVPAAVRRPDASTALARARCPGACVPLWPSRRLRAVLVDLCSAISAGRLRRLGACAPSRLLCVGLALARSPGGCALSRGEGHAPHESAGYHPPTERAPPHMQPVCRVYSVLRLRAILRTYTRATAHALSPTGAAYRGRKRHTTARLQTDARPARDGSE